MESCKMNSLYDIIEKTLTSEQLREYNRIHYGRVDHCEIKLKELTVKESKIAGLEIAAFSFPGVRIPRKVKLGLVQHSIVLPTNRPVDEQKQAIFNKVANIIHLAHLEEVQIICLQETWTMPFFLCTGEKQQWSDFAESATTGRSVTFLSEIARKYRMVVVSPILEDDNGIWWNTAVVIDADGTIMGKHRKNHLPSVGSFKETPFYSPGNTGHPVFDTKYAKIAVNICYGRLQALNWLMFGLNGAEIVFNPSATISEFGESFWGIEARNAAIANSYYTCSINRVGTEKFVVQKEDGVTEVRRDYYGSSYVTAPDGCKTPSLSKYKDGLLITEVDLNLCREIKDRWGFNMTARLDLYTERLNNM